MNQLVKLSLSLSSEIDQEIISDEKIFTFSESQKTTVIIPQSSSYQVNVTLLTNQKLFIANAIYADGANINTSANFTIGFKSTTRITEQFIDCLGDVVFCLSESTTELNIYNNHTTDSIQVTFYLGSE